MMAAHRRLAPRPVLDRRAGSLYQIAAPVRMTEMMTTLAPALAAQVQVQVYR